MVVVTHLLVSVLAPRSLQGQKALPGLGRGPGLPCAAGLGPGAGKWQRQRSSSASPALRGFGTPAVSKY